MLIPLLITGGVIGLIAYNAQQVQAARDTAAKRQVSFVVNGVTRTLDRPLSRSDAQQIAAYATQGGQDARRSVAIVLAEDGHTDLATALLNPGMLATVGDTVTVSPSAFPPGLVTQLRQQLQAAIPGDTAISGVYVIVEGADAETLQGRANGVEYTYNSGAGGGGMSGPDVAVRTGPFPRALVTSVSRSGGGSRVT